MSLQKAKSKGPPTGPWTKTIVCVALATVCWLPLVRFIFRPATDGPGLGTREVEALAKRQIRIWSDPVLKDREQEPMRRSNPEWDFMGRTFTVLALAEMSLQSPSAAATYLPVIDTIIDDTLMRDRAEGPWVFLMGYSKARPFNVTPARSLFVDGEIALMIGARRLVREKAEWIGEFQDRLRHCLEPIQNSRTLLAESYPDECWLFDHAAVMGALLMSDRLDGTSHVRFCKRWLALARTNLIDPATGLLGSEFAQDGRMLDGPEGSSIWFALHCLRLVDDEFARGQYDLARQELGRSLLGFGWSREWPPGHRNHADIDSGVVIPVLDASPGGSGLALIGAASFGDSRYLRSLCTSLNFAAFPSYKNGALKFTASNQVGDAAILYAMTLGPLWDRIRERTP